MKKRRQKLVDFQCLYIAILSNVLILFCFSSLSIIATYSPAYHAVAQTAATCSQISATTRFSKYVNSSLGIAIDYPPSWTKTTIYESPEESSSNLVVAFKMPLGHSSTDSPVNIGVYIKNLPSGGIPLDEYTKVREQNLVQIPKETNVILQNNYHAKRVDYNSTAGLPTTQVWTIKGDKAAQ